MNLKLLQSVLMVNGLIIVWANPRSGLWAFVLVLRECGSDPEKTVPCGVL